MISELLDHTDLRILNLMQDDCRLSPKQLANHLKISYNTVLDRLKKLTDQGCILGYTTLLNKEIVSEYLHFMILVKLREHTAQALLDFKMAVDEIEDVKECYHLTGRFDFHLKVSVRDMAAYNKLLNDVLLALPNVNSCETACVISTSKFDTRIKLTMK
ncbi:MULTISPECIES: Lrp/AsnC family transcriptional regulator [Pedobacter]|uniref:Lrp/AsnC family transcriptional regulator n=1 Tax=Pedobacter TaxID=84567 RepID=UPI002109BBDD|nr:MULTISPECIES: Lrp/AsnC family transcriptional regulator [unclassified Pedobacter]